ncbi:hypothetical protein NE579_16455, partial [Intestinimonas massiliensis]|nr:hypothetical protein [Intestinimonas massiliensis (ex Afouda et al. 2020)]
RTPAEYGRYMIQDSGHYEYDPNLEEFYDYERYGKLRIQKEGRGVKMVNGAGEVIYYNVVTKHGLIRYVVQAAMRV